MGMYDYDDDDRYNDSVYYQIYYLYRKNHVTVVEMQSFDEFDYNQNHFYTNPDTGEKYKFSTEEQAANFLNDNFQREYIDPEYLRGDNIFGHMLIRKERD